MRLVSSFFTGEIEFDGEHVHSLVLEGQAVFRAFLEDLCDQLDGLEGESVLSEACMPVPMSKRVALVADFVPFTVSTKELTAAAVKQLEKSAREPERIVETKRLLKTVEMYVRDCALDLPCEIEVGRLTVGALVKACGVTFAEEGLSLLEKLVFFMQTTRELLGEKLFVFVNLRSYLTDAETAAFIADATNRHFAVLLLESSERKLLPGERRRLVDENLCEIVSPEPEEI